jgi:hypothetical protein
MKKAPECQSNIGRKIYEAMIEIHHDRLTRFADKLVNSMTGTYGPRV